MSLFFSFDFVLTFEQVLRSALVAGREKEGDLATTSMEFEYLYREIHNAKFWLEEITLVVTS